MASTPAVPIGEQLKQLQAARKLALENSAYYDRIVKGVLPVIGPTSSIELKRWGAEFLAESLATPVLSMRDKESLTLSVLDTLKSLLEGEQDDAIVLKASIAAAASAYPVVFRWIIHNSYHTEAWEQISAIKSRILRIWDGAPAPVRLSCIKFAQRVVLAQTTSNGQEAKYGGLDISLGMVPANHPLLDPRLMEAEATGLLDRMLGVLQDNSSDALLVDATLNCLSILIRTRPSTSNRIINCVLNFNPLKLANSPMTPKNKVLMKSMEKTTRMLMINILKRDPNNQHGGRIQQYVERLMRSRAEIFDEAGRKRQLADQAAAQYGDLKRQKMEGAVTAAPGPAAPVQPVVIPPLASGPQTLAAVFTLTDNPGLQAFDATNIPANLVAKIVARTLNTLDQNVLDFAVNGVRSRLHILQAAVVTAAAQYAAQGAAVQPAALNPATAPLGVEEDDDDYEPNLDAAEDTEQILNKLDNAPPETALDEYADPNAALGLGPFTLPPPPLIDADVASKLSSVAASRVFGPLSSLLTEGPGKKAKAGINRLAALSYDRDSWLTVVTRLATRSTFGLEEQQQPAVKAEEGGAVSRPPLASTFNNATREMLFTYILEDWRPRIEVAVAWLSEEWYNDQLTKRMGVQNAPLHYETWALRLLDGFMTFITAQDKVLTRFLAEIPELSRELLGRLKTLCGDPNTLGLAMTSLLYLVMMRPPVRELALDTVGRIWVEYEEARPLAAKYLSKWRPGWVEQQMQLQAAQAVAGGGNGAAIAA
ncbi:putative Pre-tRNA-processing protein [Triangularia setosa]|uniref:Pre-tRNA-processing protein n=1 Tax=Triangularia setosa TaxID=2587417 RepID=A0AAN6WGC3_9PEZI|nr:putative Pre-tRNA-processing protein [Podospora setosa]